MPKTPRAILVVFALLLALPWLGQWFGLDSFARHNENRMLAERPEFSWAWSSVRDFPGRYQAYFNDNFGFRNALVRGNFLVRFGLLGATTTDSVVVGDNGWLYYNAEGEMEDCRGITRFDDDQLRKLAQVFSLKKKLLEQQGIRYLLVIPPSKCTVYPQHLPAGYQQVRQTTGLDDFINHMRQHTDVDLIDGREALLPQKQQRNLYQYTDTHWNSYGAFLLYRDAAKRLADWFPEIRPFDLADFEIVREQTPGGDLAGMMGGAEFLSDENYTFVPKRPFLATNVSLDKAATAPILMKNTNAGLPRAVIFRDSYFSLMLPFFAEHFSSSVYYWSLWSGRTPMPGIIARYQPQVVVEEIHERYIKASL